MGDNRPIGILDSGVGGLTVVKEIIRQLPHEQLIYFGDTARCPYGPRTAEEVKQFTLEIVQYLLEFNVKMVVIACNTATAAALETVKQKINIPVVGVIRPGSIAAIKNSKLGKIGVIGTEGTIQSGAYEKTLKKINPSLSIISQACPTLAPIVEDGNYTDEMIRNEVNAALKPLLNKNIDSLILGCTHYPIISDFIQDVVGPDVKLLSSADETAREVSTILYYQNIMASNLEVPSHRYLTTGDELHFKEIAEKWLGEKINVEHVKMDLVLNRK